MERGCTRWSVSGLSHSSGRKSSRPTEDRSEDCKGLASGLDGKREEENSTQLPGIWLNGQTMVPLTDTGKAGADTGFMGKVRVLCVRCPPTEAEQGAGRAERSGHRQSQEEEDPLVEPEKEQVRQGKPGERHKKYVVQEGRSGH